MSFELREETVTPPVDGRNALERDKRAPGFALEGGAIRLEPLSSRHFSKEYVSWLNDPVVCKENRHGTRAYSAEDMKRYVRSVRKDPGVFAFAIRLKRGLRHVGNVSLADISWDAQSADISILVGAKDCWGQGVGYKACALVRDYAFGRLGLHRLTCGMTAANCAMIRVAEKLGMEREGVFKDAFRKRGEFRDIVQYASINPAHKKRLSSEKVPAVHDA